MTDLADLPFEHGASVPTFSGATGKRGVHRHRWVQRLAVGPNHPARVQFCCHSCGAVQDPVKSRRGRQSRRHGNDYERELAAKLGGKRTGMYGGPDDVMVSGMFAIQSKVGLRFPGWMHAELQKLRGSGLTPLLVVADSPGPGRRRRALVVLELDDWRDLHGPTPVAP